jgi:predicted RNA polymerase sigma factor
LPPAGDRKLTVTAWQKAVDQLRAQHVSKAGLTPLISALGEQLEGADPEVVTIEDDRLGLTLACCHPALAPGMRAAAMRISRPLSAREHPTFAAMRRAYPE